MAKTKSTVVWSKIVHRERYTTRYHNWRIRAYSVHYVLECGHEQYRKGSEEPKGNRVRCFVCERIEAAKRREI